MSGALPATVKRLLPAAGAIFLALFAGVAGAAERSPRDFVVHDAPKPILGLAFETADGTVASLDRFRGKVILLNLWATWCAPCRREMPTLDRLQATLGGPAFEVVALSIDRAGLPPVRAFYREIGVAHLAIYVDRSAWTMRAVSAPALPTTLLIGPDGREIGRLIGPAAWDAPEMVAWLRDWIERLSPAAASRRAAATASEIPSEGATR